MSKPQIIEQDNYEVALKIARDKWAKQDLAVQAQRCNAEIRQSGDQTTVVLDFLYTKCEVTHPDGQVRFAEKEGEPDIWEQILMLHYIGSDFPLVQSEKVIAYSEIPDGKFYDAAYKKRTRGFMLKVFGDRPDAMLAAAKSLGATQADMGDVSACVRAFPNINLYLVMWRGDDEFPPDASILLEDRIQGFLDAEDIAVLGGITVSRVVKALNR